MKRIFLIVIVFVVVGCDQRDVSSNRTTSAPSNDLSAKLKESPSAPEDETAENNELLQLLARVSHRQNLSTRVAEDDPLFPVLIEHQASIEQKYRDSECKLADFSKWHHIESPDSAMLFPELKFANVHWGERINPAWTDKRGVSLALRLGKTIGIDSNKKNVVTELYHWGNCEAFGELLVTHRIELRDENDAEPIRRAFCDLHSKHMSDTHQRMSEREWRLGISSYDQTVSSDKQFRTIVTRTHYNRVSVDPESGRILSWESAVETSDKRKVPIPRTGEQVSG